MSDTEAPAKEPSADQKNTQHLIFSYKTGSATIRVYVLEVGDLFHGFAGSSSPLLVQRRPSLIVSSIGPAGRMDAEYNITHKHAWATFLIGLRNSDTVEYGA